MINIERNFDQILSEMQSCLAQTVYAKKTLALLPVSKGRTSEEILRLATHLKQKGIELAFGENYFDEMFEKSVQLKDIGIKWHYLGRLQSRKIPDILNVASVLHGVERVKELQKISEFIVKNKQGPFQGFYVQVNISNEPAKGGIEPQGLESLCDTVKDFNLGPFMLGLMGMAKNIGLVSPSVVKSQFESLRLLRDKYFPGKKLSMGMSDDFRLAIEQDTDIIRIGTKLFQVGT